MPEREIAYCHACGAGMDVSSLEPFTNAACPRCGAHNRVKREFGPYSLLRRHAIGGMSMVFIARDATLDREVVVKILNQEYSTHEKRIRAFEEEARITAAISHPHVVRVFTTGRAFGRFFIAMEFVTGGHFEHHMRERGPIPEAEALALAIQVAEGLKAAHHAGLIHRDIKPGNILLDADGGAKIVDFGLALVTQGGKARASEIWATPYYVPPETIECGEEDFRSDIYAFGATFYHAMAGKPPCDEESMDTNRLRRAKREVRPLAATAAWLHPATCELIGRCMAYTPNGRYRSYTDLIADLRAAREQVLGGAANPASAGKPGHGKSPRPGARLALAAALVVVAAAGVFAAKSVLGGKPEAHAVPGNNPASAPPRPTDPVATHSGGVRIAQRYAEAVEALKKGDHATARRRFGEVRDDPDVLEPTGSWAACEAVAMAYLEADAEAARREIHHAIRHIEEARGLNRRMRERFLDDLRVLRQLPPVAPVEPDAGTPDAPLRALLAGLKNWEQGMPDRAAPHFERIAAGSPEGAAGWLANYIPVARAYLDDLDTLRRLEPASFDLPPDECRTRIQELDLALVGLKTKGRARFNIRCWQLALEQAARRPAEPAETTPPAAAPDLDALGRLLRGCRFAEADTQLRAWQPENETDREKHRALMLLNQAAIAFLTELGERAAAGGDGPVRSRSGDTFEKVAGGDAKGLRLLAADGSEPHLEWSELDPESLIDLHRQWVRESPEPVDTLRRHEQAVAFGLLAGDLDRAKLAAEKLAELSPAFRRRWEQMIPAFN